MTTHQPTDDNSTPRRSVLRQIALTGGLSTAALAAGSSSATAQEQQVVPWGGQGSENAPQPCPGGTAVWNWNLSTGGNNIRINPELTVQYEDGTDQTVSGTPVGQNLVQFQVERDGGGTVVDAEATYVGTIGPGQPVLTINSSQCLDPEPPNDNDDPEPPDDVTPAEVEITEAVEEPTADQNVTQTIETGDAESSVDLEQTETNVQDGESISGDVTGSSERVAEIVERRHR